MITDGNIDWNLIRLLAARSARAYVDHTVCDTRTDAQALISSEVINGVTTVIVAFRGSKQPKDFIHDAEAWMIDLVEADGAPTACVHYGFLKDFEAINVEVVSQVKQITSMMPAQIIITGHSLGGALAKLAGLEFARQKLPLQNVVTFGQPRVGNDVFAQMYDATLHPQINGPGATLKDITYRVVNQNDIVPRSPGVLLGYRHCGQEIFLEPTGGWGLNPSLGYKLFSDALGLWTAYRKKCDVLITEHFISAYQERISGI